MAAFDASESLTPFEYGREGRNEGYGAILFDAERARQVTPDWFSPLHWGERARPVLSGGRGGAWLIDAPEGGMVLRHYLRGGWAAATAHGTTRKASHPTDVRMWSPDRKRECWHDAY